jgi:hypothetical protein
LVVAGEVADEVAAFGEDADVGSWGEGQDALAGVSSAEADVVEPSIVERWSDADGGRRIRGRFVGGRC